MLQILAYLFLAVLSITFLIIAIWVRQNGKLKISSLDESEKLFFDPSLSQHLEFDTPYQDNKDVYLSLIVPAFREEDRLPVMMNETLSFLKERSAKQKSFTWEIIIVDDGSDDGTAQVALKYCSQEGSDKVRLLKLKKNIGKGGAIRKGMLVSRGQYRLMVDADGATKINDFEKLESALSKIKDNGYGIAIGSRSHLQKDVTRKRNFFRNVLMWGFHFCVEFLGGVKGINDTQCGFKLFTRKTAQALFENLHVERWCFDVELLYLAHIFNIPASEIPVNWTEIDGSKLSPIAASLQMLKDLVKIRLCYMFGVWKIKTLKID